MRAKTVTLYSLPCVVGVAGFLVAAHQVAPSLEAWDTSTKSEIYSGQTVNHSVKRDQLPIRRTTSQAPEKHQIKLLTPSMIREIVVEPVTA